MWPSLLSLPTMLTSTCIPKFYLLVAMTHFRRTEALATIAEYKAVKSKGDPAALQKYIEERRAQIQVISQVGLLHISLPCCSCEAIFASWDAPSQHAAAIERWKLNRGVERSQKNKEMVAQRKNRYGSFIALRLFGLTLSLAWGTAYSKSSRSLGGMRRIYIPREELPILNGIVCLNSLRLSPI
jgi:hypothetical protein